MVLSGIEELAADAAWPQGRGQVPIAVRRLGDQWNGAPIYWLNGQKIADDDSDFYNGAWDSYGATTSRGKGAAHPFIIVYTGSNTEGNSRIPP